MAVIRFSVARGVATVVLTKTAGVSVGNIATMVNGMTYQDISTLPTAGSRSVTLTQIQDTGGTANGGVDTTSLAIGCSVNVVEVNHAPTLVSVLGC